jgi:uncharacterized protein (DUF362 family)
MTEHQNKQQRPETVDRRTFLTGTAAGLVVGTGLLACEDTQAEPAKPVEPTPAPSPAPVEAAPEPAPAQQQGGQGDAKPQDKGAGAKGFPMQVKGRVLQVTHSGATTNIAKTNGQVVEQMVREALVKFTGEKDAAAAMARFLKPDDVVGIKVNTLGSPLASVDPETAFALARVAHEMGIPKNKIVIYDQYGSRMRKGRFQPQREGQADPKDDFAVHFHETQGYADEKVDLGGFFKFQDKDGKYKKGSSQLPKVLGRLTAVINVCVPKDHDLTGVTGALKNVSYGNIERVPVYHCQPDCNPKCVHGVCNVARLYQHAQMGGKVRLVVLDALRVLYQGGPQDNQTYKKAHNAIMVSTDPVSTDRIILELVNTYRQEKGLKPVEQDAGGRRAPRFIAGAAELGLGEAELAKIQWEKISLG